MLRRTVIKWLHWISFFAITYFFLVEPDESRADPGGALSTHSGVGAVLGVAAAIWLSIFLIKGVAGRAGPKLPNWGKRVHPILHKLLYVLLPIMVLSGAITGLLAPFAISAFGIVQINTAAGSKTLHELAQEVHEVIFDGLLIVIAVHILFHLWRHFILKDNALRIMFPKFLHRYL